MPGLPVFSRLASLVLVCDVSPPKHKSGFCRSVGGCGAGVSQVCSCGGGVLWYGSACACSTSPSGRKQVDGLPPALHWGPRILVVLAALIKTRKSFTLWLVDLFH